MTFRFSMYRHFCIIIIFFLTIYNAVAQQTELSKAGVNIIPYPKEVNITASDFILAEGVVIVIDKNASESDRFAAEQLSDRLSHDFKIKSSVRQSPSSVRSIVLTRNVQGKKLQEQEYSLIVNADRVTIRAGGEEGLFYGVQTLFQLIQNKNAQTVIKGVEIFDWPDTQIRAAHYDTKHHQDKREYVEKFIRDLAAYKINMIVWEWEDKLAYTSHPEVGAPGAFTMQDMQEFTRYAKKFHIQLTPLVQGLGHSSYILKWPQFAHLREIPASNFEFCPLKDSSYELLFDLWEDAIKATPGSEYIHIGSDETYELGECAACKKKAEEIGKNGLYHLFTTRAAKHLQAKGRKVMIWERPMGWVMGENATHKNISPQKGIVLTESYGYETRDLKYAKDAKALGFPVFAYDPNPGVEPLFLPYFFRKPREFAKEKITGSLENSYNFLSSQLGQGVFDGVICTSWDDSGLHNQVWMMRFAAAAAFSWNASKPSLPEFTSSFFKNYYGSEAKDVERLFYLLNEGGIYFMEAFERSLWHDKKVGRTRIPDLPRGDVLEYNPFWNDEYKEQVKTAGEMLVKMDQALAICKTNRESRIKNDYDFEVFETIAELVKHTALTYLDLSRLETAVAEAHRQRHLDYQDCYRNLEKAEDIVQKHLERRERTLNHLITVWEKTRLPKGMSTGGKKFFFEQDRTIHFANRAPDMSFLTMDEQKLGLEEYLVKLREVMETYREKFIGPSYSSITKVSDSVSNVQLPAGYFKLLEAGIPRIEKRLADEPRATLGTIESSDDWSHFPGAILAPTVLYAKKHKANTHYGDKRMLSLAQRIGDLLVAENKKKTYTPRHDSDWDTYLWLEAYRILETELGEERRNNWKEAILENVALLEPKLTKYENYPWYNAPFIITSPNHYAIYASTMLVAARVFNKPEWETMASRVLHRFVTEEQSIDGYWGEQNQLGPTTGYDYLTETQIALYWEYARDPMALKALRKSTDFHKYYTYPDGTPVETINDRNRYWEVPRWGHFGFSNFADGRRFAAFLTKNIPEDGGDMQSLGRIAQNALYYHEGKSTSIPQDESGYSHSMNITAGIRKAGPWVVTYSGLMTPKSVLNNFFLDRQSNISVFNEQKGLIISGANSKWQPELATFNEKIGTHLNYMPLNSRLQLSDTVDRLAVAYDAFFAVIEVPSPSQHQLKFTVRTNYKWGEANAKLTLQLMLKPGQMLETGSGKTIIPGKDSITLDSRELGGWIHHNEWKLQLPPDAILKWPVFPYNPYTSGPEVELARAIGTITVPFWSGMKERAGQEFSFVLEVDRTE